MAFNLASMKIRSQQWEMTKLNATIFTLKFEIGIFLTFKALNLGYPGSVRDLHRPVKIVRTDSIYLDESYIPYHQIIYIPNII